MPTLFFLAASIYTHLGELRKDVLSLRVVRESALGEGVAVELLGDETVPQEDLGDLLVRNPAQCEDRHPRDPALRTLRHAVEQPPKGALGDIPRTPVTVSRSAPETARPNSSVGSSSSRFSAKPASRMPDRTP